jgi:predicted O-methyltransferase YrrM
MSSLVEIGGRHGSDKGTAHRYWQVYDILLARLRDSAVRVLEIGTLAGESLKVWGEYFPNAHIHGADIQTNDVEFDRLSFYLGDAYTSDALESLGDGFDVIIDDGPHTLESMCFVARYWSRRLAPGGVLVIEDIPNAAWVPQIARWVPGHLQEFMFAVDRRMVPGCKHGDDVLFVIDRASEVV